MPSLRMLLAMIVATATLLTGAASFAKTDVLVTPRERFAGLPDYPFTAYTIAVPWGEAKVSMAYVDEGPRTGPTVVLLHGQPSWSFMYRKVIAGLSAQGFRVLAPDLIGYGRSDKPASMDDYSYDRHLKAVEAFVQSLNIRNATLVVHDWGGLLGLPTAAAMPERFARLALFNTSLNDGTDPETPQFKAGFDRWIERLRTVPVVEVDKVIEAQTAKRPADAVLAAYMAPFPSGAYQSGVRRMSALIPRVPSDPRARENGDVRRFLSTWRKPVLIAFSADSDRIHPGQFELFKRLFPAQSQQAALQLTGTKHFLFEDAPDEATRLIADFARGRPVQASAAPPAPLVNSALLAGTKLQADVVSYTSTGEQRTGSAASAQTLDWLDERLRRAGYATRRVPIPVTAQELGLTTVKIGNEVISDGFPAWPVVTTPAPGLTGPLRSVDAAKSGDIVFVRLPFSQYASVFDPLYRPILAAVLQKQPGAIVAVTDHPTGEVVALNVRGAEQQGTAVRRDIPMLLVGAKHAGRLEAAARQGEKVTLTLRAQSRVTTDANLIATAGPTGQPAVVISTPKNGWFQSGGERGPGIAIALGLADWLRAKRPDLAVKFVFTSHHELGGAGMRAALADPEFSTERVRLWIHLGANIAAREASLADGRLTRGVDANSQRGIAATDSETAALRAAFAAMGVSVRAINDGGQVGEIALVARRPKQTAIGAVGYQLLHHTRLDDANSTSPQTLEPFARALATYLEKLK